MSADSKQIELDPEVELLVGFVNTVDIEDGEDALEDRADAALWLAAQDAETSDATAKIAKGASALSAADHAHLIAFREALRALLRANNGGDLDDAETAALREAAGRSHYGVALDPGGRLALEPRGADAAERFEARLLLAIQRLQDGGEWPRLKACPAEVCQWAFFDTTRNHSRTWCSMGVCGNRAKTRRYRSR